MTDPLNFTKPLDDVPGALEITEIDGFLSALREILAPRFEEERISWEREGPAATAAFEATGATLDHLGGNCPVQAKGSVDGQRFYFRARGDEWQFHVAPDDDAIFEAPTFYLEHAYGAGFEAGWMDRYEALRFIVEGIGIYRAVPLARAIAPTLTETQRGLAGTDLDAGLPAGVAVTFIMNGMLEKDGEDSVRWSTLGLAVARIINQAEVAR